MDERRGFLPLAEVLRRERLIAGDADSPVLPPLGEAASLRLGLHGRGTTSWAVDGALTRVMGWGGRVGAAAGATTLILLSDALMRVEDVHRRGTMTATRLGGDGDEDLVAAMRVLTPDDVIDEGRCRAYAEGTDLGGTSMGTARVVVLVGDVLAGEGGGRRWAWVRRRLDGDDGVLPGLDPLPGEGGDPDRCVAGRIVARILVAAGPTTGRFRVPGQGHERLEASWARSLGAVVAGNPATGAGGAVLASAMVRSGRERTLAWLRGAGEAPDLADEAEAAWGT